MHMTDREIVGKFNRAVDKKEQIEVLSGLNTCTSEEIIEVLLRNGVKEEDIPKKKKSRGKREVFRDPNMKQRAEAESPKEEQSHKEEGLPEVARAIFEARIAVITAQINALEKEKSELCGYLGGVASA